MYAYELQVHLAALLGKSDFSGPERGEMAERFASLRGYGRLPIGVEKRGQRLTPEQVASAVFGMAPSGSKWAGHSATSLSRLLPVGGAQAAPTECTNLSLLVERLITDKALRDRLVNLTLSGAEAGINSQGRALLTYDEGGERRRVAYISGLAFSTQSPGAEVGYDYEARYASSSRELSLSRAFFEELSGAYEMSLMLGRPPNADPSEYDAEEALKALYRALGVRSSSRYLNVGVETSVEWPNAPCRFAFGNSYVVALPATKDNEASLHLDLTAHGLDDIAGRALLSEVMSIAVWLDDQAGMVFGGWSGNHAPIGVPRSTQRFPTSMIAGWCNYWQRVDDAQIGAILGLYREARNLELTHSIPYAFLGYYRIFESIQPDGKKRTDELSSALEQVLSSERFADWKLDQADIEGPFTARALADEIFARRQQTAHAKKAPHVNPDESEDVRKLSVLTTILRLAARQSMTGTMGIAKNRWALDWRGSK